MPLLGNFTSRLFTAIAKIARGASLEFILNNPNAHGTSATSESDYFGYSAAISGDYAIVGAYYESDAGGLQSGKAYIYNVTTGALLFTLNNPNAYGTSAGDLFGNSVAISGNYAVVGAYQEDDAGGTGSGKAYIYNVTTGALVHTLNNPTAYGTSAGDLFGVKLAVSGDYAVVGASGEDDAGGTGSGKAYIYNVTTGALLFTLNNPTAYGTSADDYFGSSVAISGNYAVVGAYGEGDASGTRSGKAYIFNVTTGVLVHTLTNPNPYGFGSLDYFGNAVAISGNYAVVGASGEGDASDTETGKAYIFNVTTGALLFTLTNPNVNSPSRGAFTGDQFGYAVAVSGNYAVVSAIYEDDADGYNSGKAYIYNVTTGALVQKISNPNAYGSSSGDNFGNSSDMSGNYAIVGAYGESGPDYNVWTGKAYIFNVTTGVRVHTLNNPNPYGTSNSDYFGWSVAISGNYAMVGAYQEDDAGGTSSGKAYIYNVTTGALVHTLNNPNINTTTPANDFFGYSVAISNDYAVVGASQEDEDANSFNNSGKVYIYNVTTGALLFTLSNPNAYGTSVDDNFGSSVAISGNYVIVGAQAEDDAGALQSGKAYIYNVTTGALLFTLNNPNTGDRAYHRFGWSVAVSGDYAIAGAFLVDDTNYNSGKAHIYNVTTGALVHTLNNPNAYGTSQGDYFGYSVAISGNYAIVGAYLEDDAGGTESGKAYIYNVTTGALLFTLNNPNAYGTSAGDNFGWSVAMSGNYAIVCAYTEDDADGNDSGKAYIFDVTTGALVHTLNNPNAFLATVNDYFGFAVGISNNRIIVGSTNTSYIYKLALPS